MLSLFLMTLTELRSTSQVQCPQYIVLTVRLGLCIYVTKTMAIRYHFPEIMTSIRPINMSYLCDVGIHHLAEVRFIRFVHY